MQPEGGDRPPLGARFVVIVLLFFLSGIVVRAADAAEDGVRPLNSVLHGLEFVAPASRWAVRVELRQNGYDSYYGADGRRQALGQPLDGVVLDASLLPALAPFGADASLGTTRFRSQVTTQRVELTLGYGLSDDLTIGVIVPYGKVRTTAEFAVDGGNIGFNPDYDPTQPPSSTNSPLLPVGMGPSVPVGTEGVQQILSDPAFGFAYRPLRSTEWQGFGDPTLGLLWRFYKSKVDSLILGGGVRFGVAKDVDADDLLQVPIDDGSTDFRLRLDYFRDMGDDIDLFAALEGTWQFEDSVIRRVAEPGQLLATAASKERLDRKLGNYVEYDLGIGKVLDDWRVSATWHRYAKQGDSYRSSKGSDLSALEANTRLYANQWRASLSWSGIRAWRRGDFPLPLVVELELQQTYAARNFPDIRDLYLQLTSFF